jgi:hypothetical protein
MEEKGEGRQEMYVGCESCLPSRRVVQINIIIAKWEKYEMVKLKNIN